MALGGEEEGLDVGGTPVCVDDEVLGLCGGDGRVPVFGEGVGREDGHVGHGDHEVFGGVVDGDVLGCSGEGVLVAEGADVGRVEAGGVEG